jgi:ribosomal protein S13
MNVSDILNKLGSIVGVGDEAGAIAAEAVTITNQFKVGQLSQSEYQELVGDLKTEKLILIGANQLILKEDLDVLFTNIQSAISIFPML